jgi:hypothetical protein
MSNARNKKDRLVSISNDQIRFATAPSEETLFPTLGRVVVVIGPREAVTIAGSGDKDILRKLVAKLREPTSAWAAEVVLAAMTGHEADIVNSYAADPKGWWESLGKTAYERWSKWLHEVESNLVWDPQRKVFVNMDGQI